MVESNADSVTIGPTAGWGNSPWYYTRRINQGSWSGCTGPVTGDVTIATGLAAGALLGLKMYAAAGCSELTASIAHETPFPALKAVGFGSGSVTLRIERFKKTNWAVKQNSPSGGGCTTAPAGTSTVTVSGITAGIQYKFSIHVGTNCNNPLAGTEVTFTAPELSATEVGATSAKLVLSGGTGDAWWYKETGGINLFPDCIAADSTTHTIVRGLVPSNSWETVAYTFTAYGDAACAHKLDATTLSTLDPGLTAVHAGSNSVRVSLTRWGPHDGGWYYRATVIEPHSGKPIDFGPDGCQGPATGTSAVLTDLPPLPSDHAYYLISAHSRGPTKYPVCHYSTVLGRANLPGPVAIGNLGAIRLGLDGVGKVGPWENKWAQGFTTGPGASGYTLDGITAEFEAPNGSPANIVVAIHERGSDGHPAAALMTLTTESNPASAGEHAWTCSGDCALSRSTTYFVVMSAPGSGNAAHYKWRTAATGAETTTPVSSGWSFEDRRKRHFSGTWRNADGASHFIVRIEAHHGQTPTRSLASSHVYGTQATLTLSGYAGSWYAKDTSRSNSACRGPAHGSSLLVTGLTASTSYTFAAYGAPGCAESSKLATASAFTTTTASSPALTVNAATITASGATLALANHTGNWWYRADKAPDASCQGPVSATTRALTDLAGYTQYVYTAYRDGGCTVSLATADRFRTKPSLTATAITDTTATLTLRSAAPNWWYKRTAPTGDATCHSAGAGTAPAELTGLTRNTNYTYQAHRDSACTSLVVSASFRTLAELNVTALQATSVSLTLGGAAAPWSYRRTAPALGACVSEGTLAYVSVSGLTQATAYTYEAYAGTSCAAPVLARASFTTLLRPPQNVSHAGSCSGGTCSFTASWQRNDYWTGPIGYEAQKYAGGSWTDWLTVSPTTAAIITRYASTGVGDQITNMRVRAYKVVGREKVYSAWVE